MFKTNFLKRLPYSIYEYRLSEISLGMLSAENGKLGVIKKIQSVYRVIDTGTWSGLNSMSKLYSSYKVRLVASKCISHYNSALVKSFLLIEYLSNPEFVEYLKNFENIKSYPTYLRDNYGFTRYCYKLFKRKFKFKEKYVPVPIDSPQITIYKNIEIMGKKDIEATVILAYIRRKGSVSDMFEEVYTGKHTAKEYLTIARAYKEGRVVIRDIDESIRWYDIAIEAGDKWSRIELVSLLMQRNDKTSQLRAFNIASRIAMDKNDIHCKEAIVRLARMYSRGIGTEIDVFKSVSLYRSVISDDNPQLVKEYVEIIYNNPQIINVDDVITLSKIMNVNNYSGKIQLILSRVYRKGDVVDKNIEKALEFLYESIDNGFEWSKVELVSCLLNGTKEMKEKALSLAEEWSHSTDSIISIEMKKMLVRD